jgi:hypothetical protein
MSDGKGGSIQDRGQHVGTPGGTADNGQKETPRDPKLGREAVPASPKDGDVNTERKS